MLPSAAYRSITVNTKPTIDVDSIMSYKFDFSTNEFLLEDGKMIKVYGKDAVKIWIEKTLRTEKFKFSAYKETNNVDEYGCKLEDLIVGELYDIEYIKSEITREIKSALTKHPAINSIEGVQISKSGTVLIIGFKCNLSNNEELTQEVKYNV